MKIAATQYRSFTKTFEDGGFPHLRFGQAFINHFETACPHDANEQLGTNHPCIFHADRKVAQAWIEANGIDWSK
jgi:hypothetical protein